MEFIALKYLYNGSAKKNTQKKKYGKLCVVHNVWVIIAKPEETHK